LPKLFKQVSDKIQLINNQETNKQLIKTDVSQLKLDVSSFSKIRNYDSDWIEPDTLIANETIYRLYKTWQVEFSEIDIKYLSFFRYDILAKLNTTDVEGDISGDASGFYVPYNTYFSKSFVWDIKDLEDDPSSDTKRATLNASIYLVKPTYLTLPLFKVKLLVKFLPLRQLD